MSNVDKIGLTGKSGLQYQFSIHPIYPIFPKFKSIGVVYAITKRTKDFPNERWMHTVYYIGVTNDLDNRLNGHHKLINCINIGANCICVHVDVSKSSREFKELDLITSYSPRMNELLK